MKQPMSDEMDAYERLLGDAMHGEATLFARQDVVEASWAVVDPLLSNTAAPIEYPKGSWGPAEADRLTEAVGGWSNPR
jgi:glucose-6-phosphate 1-dehydrogenase